MAVEPQFGSFVYGSNDCLIDNFEYPLSVRSAAASVPKSDVARTVDGYLGPRQITISGVITNPAWTARSSLRTALDAFMWAHRAGYRSLYLDDDRYLTAEVKSLTLERDLGLLYLPFSVRFEAGDPYWQSTTQDTDTWNSGLIDAATRSLTNGGSADAYPVFTVTINGAGVTDLTLTNTTLSADNALTLDSGSDSLNAGAVLEIDCASQTVTLDGSNAMDYFSGDFFKLDPGANTIRLNLNAGNAATLTSIVTTWRERWL